MLKNERQDYILNLIKRQQYIKVTELTEILHVSDETIRRDLVALERNGQLHCVHGGAIYDSSSINEYHVNVRMRQNQTEKESICREAAKLIHDDQSIAVQAATTTTYLGDYILKKSGITLVTNSVLLASKVSMNEHNKVIMVGGDFWNQDQKTMGATAVTTFSEFNVDLGFISVSGTNIDKGLTEYQESEVQLTRAVINSAKRVILLNDYTKFDLTAFRTVAGLDEINDMVTDWHTTSEMLKPYELSNICIHRAQKE